MQKFLSRLVHNLILPAVFCLLILMGCGKKDNPVPPETDTTPPRIIYAYPQDSAQSLPRNTIIYLIFSEPMNRSSVQGAFSCGVSGDFRWFGSTVVFVPASPFAANDTVRLSVSSAAQDNAGNGLAPAFSRWFVTGGVVDDVRPTVSALAPAAGQSGVAVGANISLRASEPILQFIIGQVKLTDSLGNSVPGNTSWQDSVTVVFNPSSDLANNMRYTVTVDTILRDRCWNRNEMATWQFTTEADNIKPTVVSITPANGSQEVSLKDSVVVTFSEPMDTASVRAAFSISPALSGTIAWSGLAKLKFKPSQIMAVRRAYAVNIDTAARDINGNRMAAAFNASFITDRVVYAACTSANMVYVMAKSSGQEVQRISASSPVDVACSPDGSKLYVLSGGASGSLKVLDPNDAHSQVRSIAVGSQPYALAISSSGRHLAVSNYAGNSITVIDTLSWAAVTFDVEAGPKGLGFGNNNNILVVCTGARYLYSYPLAGGPWQYRSYTIVEPGSEGLSLSAGRDTLYLCEGSKVSVFASTTDFPWASSSAIPSCSRVLRRGNLLYVSDSLSNRVRVYQATPTGNFLQWQADITVGTGPKGLGLSNDGTKLYSANSGSGNLSVINLTTNAVEATWTVGSGAAAVAASP